MNPCINHTPEESIAAHYPDAVEWRRQLHRNPQPAWLEFYATGFVAEKLAAWGYDLLLGKDIIAAEKRVLVPDPEILQAEYDRAIRAGASEKFLAPAKGGFTGVVGVLRGALPGPTIGFRFDIDALEVVESSESSHRPAADGFISQTPGCGHMCGHDTHMAMGLLLARYFAENREKLKGTVKFLFQPNEENLGGALTMVEKGQVDDLDYLFGAHVGINLKEAGHIAMDVHSFMALSRFEVTYKGRSTHAALRPNEGKNALLGACAAITNLYAIARHGLGASRVNVGILQAGTTWNIIPDRAYFRMETRGVTNEINDYMVQKSKEVLEGAAKMYDLDVEIKPAATALSARSSPELVELGTRVARTLPSVKEITAESAFNASEDVTVMMERVQGKGGKALFVLLGTAIHGGHHSTTFDVDESVIRNGAEFFAALQDAVTQGV
jgi:aminobenzoyl-glutamate utilization protein A